MTRGRDLLNGGAACYGIYETADGRFVTLGALEPKFWAAFCEAVGRRDWIDRQAEPLPQDDLIAEVAAFFERRSLAEWRAELDGIDCCWQPVLDAEDLLADPHAVARGLRQRSGDLVEVFFPALMDDRASAPRRPLEEVSADDVLQAWRSA